jgi:hypothetical protein
VLLLINPVFRVSPGPQATFGQLSCVSRAYLWRPSVICCTCTFVRRVALLFPHCPRFYHPPLNSSLPLMSHTHPTSTSSNFKPIFDNALKAYKKRTKNDLLKHQLADRLEACNSASNILTVLQEQVQELNQSQRSNTKWLDPTVNVLLAFSETLGEGVGSVCFRTRACPRSTLSYLFDRYSHLQR